MGRPEPRRPRWRAFAWAPVGVVALASTALSACETDLPRPTPQSPGVPGGSGRGAWLGDLEVGVRELEEARGLRPGSAARLVAEFADELRLAAWAESSREDRGRALWRLALARRLVDETTTAAAASGPPSAGELAQVKESLWWQLARPRMVRTAHAVALLGESSERQSARALADRLRGQLGDRASAESLQALVESSGQPRERLRFERLPPVSLDGRTVEPMQPPPLGPAPGQLDSRFAAVAAALESPGDVSPVVETRFGYHVIVAVEIIEPSGDWLPETEETAKGLVLKRRAGERLEQVLADQRARTPVSVEQSAPLSSERVLRGE